MFPKPLRALFAPIFSHQFVLSSRRRSSSTKKPHCPSPPFFSFGLFHGTWGLGASLYLLAMLFSVIIVNLLVDLFEAKSPACVVCILWSSSSSFISLVHSSIYPQVRGLFKESCDISWFYGYLIPTILFTFETI